MLRAAPRDYPETVTRLQQRAQITHGPRVFALAPVVSTKSFR
jgi:hypothetical protein